MKFVPFRLAAVYRRGTGDIHQEPVVAREYETANEAINIAEVTLRTGIRYPEKGCAVNDICTMAVYIAAGEGKITFRSKPTDTIFEIRQGDVVEISPGEEYFWVSTNNLILVPASSPAWTIKQHRYVE